MWCMLHYLQIAAICQEAGMHAVRKNRYVILPKDFEKGYRTNVKKPDTDFEFYKWSVKVAKQIFQKTFMHVHEVFNHLVGWFYVQK